jgi:hypothetical protein
LWTTQHVFNWFSRNVYQLWETGSSSFTSIAWWWNSRRWKGRFSDKVIKIPSRRGPDALRFILNDFEANERIVILDYYDAQGEKYFMNS